MYNDLPIIIFEYIVSKYEPLSNGELVYIMNDIFQSSLR